MGWAAIKNWLRYLLKYSPIAISILALGVSWHYSQKAIKMSEESLLESKRSNKIAQEAKDETKKHFATANRPLLIVEQVKSYKTNEYLEINIDDDIISVITVISIKNVGSIIAGNMFVHSSTGVLIINNKQIARDKQKYKPLNPNDNLSSLHIPPDQNIMRQMKYKFKLPPGFSKEEIRKETVSLIQNILIHYYSDTKQMPHELAKDFHYHTNVTHNIRYNGYATTMQMF